MFVIIANDVFMGTYEVLKNMDRLGIINIIQTSSYELVPDYDENEMEYLEKFKMYIKIPENNPIDDSGNGFIFDMIKGLSVTIKFCLKTEL